MKLYKVLNHFQSCTAGKFDWIDYLPHDEQPGKWTPWIAYPVICSSGYHGTDAEHLLEFINGNQLFEAEAKGIIWEGDGTKFTSQSMRLIRQIPEWNDRTLRLFAVWCVKENIDHFSIPDPILMQTCNVAERFANGEASREELNDARNAISPINTLYRYWEIPRSALNDSAWRAARDIVWLTDQHSIIHKQRIKFMEMLGLRQIIPCNIVKEDK